MTKTIIEYDKSDPNCDIHRLPKGIQEFHRRFGLWVCSFGQGNHGTPIPEIQPRYFEFYSLSHMYDGNGYYWTRENEIMKVSPGQAILSAPGFVHFYSGDNDYYIEDSICFTGPMADQLFSSGIISNGIMNFGLERRLLPIMDLSIDPAQSSQLKANMALLNLLTDLWLENRASGEKEQYPGIARLLQELRERPEKWWTVEEMAEYSNLSLPQFRRVFRRYTGMAPKHYIESLKIQQAAQRLLGTSVPVAEVTAEFGYKDQFHFSRRFKKVTGMAPGQYRREMAKVYGHKANS